MLSRKRQGQALIEFALVAPVMFALIGLVFAAGILVLTVIRAQNAIMVLTELAAAGGGWESQVGFEIERTGCNPDPRLPDMVFSDGPSGTTLVLGTWHCTIDIPPIAGFNPDPFRYTVSSESVIRPEGGPIASASPSP